MEITRLLGPLGILAYLIALSAAISGLLRWNIKYHKALALTAIILATAHVIIIFIFD